MKNQNDILWKVIIEHFFYDFLTLIDPDLAVTIDRSREITFMDKELHQQTAAGKSIFEAKIVDKLVKLYTNEGEDQWILLHLEVQHKYEKDFSERMYGYYNRLYQQYKKPITAYAILTEPNGILRDNVYKTRCGGTTLEYNFNTYKVALQDDEFLSNHSNPFALVVLIAKQNELRIRHKDKELCDEMLLQEKLRVAKLIFEKDLSAMQENALINFLFYYVHFEFSETQVKFEQGIKSLTKKNITNMTIKQMVLGITKQEGIRIGEQKGKRLEKTAVVTRMLEKNIFTDEQIMEFAGVSLRVVSSIKKKLDRLNQAVN